MMRQRGAAIDVIGELLGHADLRMAKRYQHLSPEFLLKAVSGLDRAFDNLDSNSVGAESNNSGSSKLIN
jgi:hypothetical protein